MWSSANEDINCQSISILTPTDFCSDRPIFRQFRQEIENTFCLNHCHKFEWERFRCELIDHYGSTHHHLPARSWDKDSISSHILWKYDWILNWWVFYEIILFFVDAWNDQDGWAANKARKTDFHSGWSFPVRYALWPVRQHALALRDSDMIRVISRYCGNC